MLDAFMPAPMFPGSDGGPRGPGWFMNWLLYAWFGAIWKEELIWKTKTFLFKIQTQIKCLLAQTDDCAICNCETTSLQALRKEKAHKADSALVPSFLTGPY